MPLVLQEVITECENDVAAMAFEYPVYDSQGNQIGTKTSNPTQQMVTQLGQAMGKAIYNILTQQVLVNVTVAVTTAPGVAIGTGEIE
jgi:hypothetical protein